MSSDSSGTDYSEKSAAQSETGMRSEEASSRGKVVVVSGTCGNVEEVRVSLCSRSIRFYNSSQETPGPVDAFNAEEEGTRPPSVPRSRWLFPEEELPVLQWRRPRRCGVGLGNPHALCFMNAVLQALAYTPGVADDLLEGRHSSRCPLAASTAAARRQARLLQQRNGAAHAHRQTTCSVKEPAAVLSTSSAVSIGEKSSGEHGEHPQGLMRRTTRGGCRDCDKGASSVTETDSDAAVSFCLLCKLEEQIQSIHCASCCPSGAFSTKQQTQNGTKGGVARGFVRNRFSRYVKQFVWRRYREGRQEDAHEFLRYLLDALMRCGSGGTCKRGTDTLRMPPEVWLTSYFGQLFGGWLQSSVCCSSCGYCSKRFDACFDLPLDLTPAPAAPGSSCLSSVNSSGVGGEFRTTTASGKRRFNSSNRADDAAGGEVPASKLIKRKIFAACTTTDELCSDSTSVAQQTIRESTYSAVTQTVTTARRILYSGGRILHEKERKKRSPVLREGGSTIEKALQNFVAPEYLTGENSYSCPQCKQKRPATKQLRVHTPPRVLVLPIKRFAVGCWGGAARMGASCYNPFAAHSFLLKNQTPVAFPAVLNLAPYMVSPPSEVTTMCAAGATPAQMPCSDAALSGTVGCLKEDGEAIACVTAPAGCTQQLITPHSSSLKLEKLSFVSEKCRSKSHGTVGKEDEASPRSDASINSTSTRASSSPSPSPSRSEASVLNHFLPHSCASSTSVSSNDLGCTANNEVLRENAPEEHSTHAYTDTTSPTVAINNIRVGISNHSSAVHNGSNPTNPTTPLQSATGPSAANVGNDRPAAPPLYQLYAVVTHTGSSLSSGHYRCFVRAPASAAATTCKGGSEDEAAAASASMWLLIDDEVVQTVSEIFVLQRLQHDAYLLFYSRIPSVQQQQELLLKDKMEKQQCSADFTRTTEQGQFGGEGCEAAENQAGKRELMHDGEFPTTIYTGRRHTRRSVSSVSDASSDDYDCHSSCDSTTSCTQSSCSDHSDEPSASSNSTYNTTNSDTTRWSDDEEVDTWSTRRIAARLRSRPYDVPAITARAHVGTSRKKLCLFLQRQKLQQIEGFNRYFSYGKKFRTQRLLALQVSLLLRQAQKQRRLDAAASRKDNSQAEEQTLAQNSSQHRTEKGGSSNEDSQIHKRQFRHQTEEDRGKIFPQEILKKASPVQDLRILSTEEMRCRMKAASSFANQYGVAHPSEWTDEEEDVTKVDEGEMEGKKFQPRRSAALERLQELQQPCRQLRSRHDREYDLGKVKKVKKKLSTKELAIGETVIVKSRDGDTSELVVHQRTAFDKVIEQQKQGRGRKVQLHSKKQPLHGRQGASGMRAKRNRAGGPKYGQGYRLKSKH